MNILKIENGFKPNEGSENPTPDFLTDLNLDQIIKSIIEGKDDYDLEPFFLTKLPDKNSILARQNTFRDLEDEDIFQCMTNFAEKMVIMHRYLNFSKSIRYQYHQKGWFLEAALAYIHALTTLLNDSKGKVFNSGWLRDFFAYLSAYLDTPEFQSFCEQSKEITAKLSSIQYDIIIKNNWVRVRKFRNEINFREEVQKFFKKFQVGNAKDYLIEMPSYNGLSHVHAQILQLVAELYPDEFVQLDQYYHDYHGFLDNRIIAFEQEIQFYISYLDYIRELKGAGLNFCYPVISTSKKRLNARGCFDLALAKKLIGEKKRVICNDFSLSEPERIIIVSGPNQGGKTTFARMIGQLHYLANLGCPVPGSSAHLLLFDNIFTHFEREETIKNLRGKLQDDLIRIKTILEKSTGNSIIIMNEIFTTTTLKDAVYLSKRVVEKILALDSLSVFVTFIDELSRLSEKTISMVSMVLPENPAIRTFKVIRKPADGLAYAKSIAEKYHLTYEELKKRIKS